MNDCVEDMGAAYLVGDVGSVVPEGYKQTEVGVIPEDWCVMSIDHALTKGYLRDQMDGNHGELYPKSHEFISDGIPYIGATDFRHGKVDYKNCKYLSIKRANTFKKGIAKNGDVLFAHNATVGPVALLRTDFDFVILSTTATYYRCNEDFIINLYLAKYFESKYFVEQYSAVMSQSTRNQVPILSQRKFQIVLPSIKEQTAIANALSDVDALISEQEKLIAKKQAIKTATMQQLLTGRTRLPQFALREDGTVKGYKQSELGEVPEDWEVGKLGSQVVFVGSGKTNTDNTGEYPLYGSTGVIGSCENIEYKGDALLVARVGANAGKLNFVSGDYGVSDNTIIVKFNSNAIIVFFEFLMKRQNLNKLVFGSGQPLITGSQLKQLLVSFPRIDEQAAIAKSLSEIEHEINALKRRLIKIKSIKNGMMQELLTGKTRLIKPEQVQ